MDRSLWKHLNQEIDVEKLLRANTLLGLSSAFILYFIPATGCHVDRNEEKSAR